MCTSPAGAEPRVAESQKIVQLAPFQPCWPLRSVQFGHCSWAECKQRIFTCWLLPIWPGERPLRRTMPAFGPCKWRQQAAVDCVWPTSYGAASWCGCCWCCTIESKGATRRIWPAQNNKKKSWLISGQQVSTFVAANARQLCVLFSQTSSRYRQDHVRSFSHVFNVSMPSTWIQFTN